MAFVSSEDESDQQSERCGSYSLSADVSESESSSSNFSCRRFDAEGASSSMSSSPLPVARNFFFPAPVMMPVIGGKDVVVWDEKPEKRVADLSGILSLFSLCLLLHLFILLFHFLSLFLLDCSVSYLCPSLWAEKKEKKKERVNILFCY